MLRPLETHCETGHDPEEDAVATGPHARGQVEKRLHSKGADQDQTSPAQQVGLHQDAPRERVRENGGQTHSHALVQILVPYTPSV